jgi:hypothetical protein
VISIQYNGSEFIFVNAYYQFIHSILFCPIWWHCLNVAPNFSALSSGRRRAEADPITKVCTDSELKQKQQQQQLG